LHILHASTTTFANDYVGISGRRAANQTNVLTRQKFVTIFAVETVK